MSLNGSNVRKLAARSGGPAFSPDGRTIAFASDRDENGELCYGDICILASELYVMSVDGSGQERLTETTDLNEVGPVWSPDGKRIAYQRGEVIDNAQGTGVFAVNSDGSCSTPIAYDQRLDTWYAAPNWRPDIEGPGPLFCFGT